ncbi:MAG: hypothetical protein ACI8P0_003711, partial [Planctomycetaceae bacterium]
MRYQCTKCESCGAPLEIANRSKQATCNYCQSLSDATDLETLRWRLRNVSFQLELDLVDRNWLAERERLMVRNASGQLTVPSRFRVILVGTSVLLMCLGWIVGLLMQQSAAAILGVMIGTPVAVWMAIACQRANDFLNARRQYDHARAQIRQQFTQTPVEQDIDDGSTSNRVLPTERNPSGHSDSLTIFPRNPIRAALPNDISNLDFDLKVMTLEAELQGLEADHRRHRERFNHQAASSPDNKSTHTTSIALLIGPVALITLATTMEPAGILIAAPLTIATFLSEV